MNPLRISVLLLTYNQRPWVDAAVGACLAQLGEPLDVVLSDDASTDGTHERLLELAAGYQGPHRVRVRRNAGNLGIGGHYNRAVSECQGQLIVTAAGDDISLPHRVQTLAAAWDATGCRADLVSSHLLDMAVDGSPMGTVEVDDLSRWTSPDDWVRQRPRVVGAAHAFTPRLFERFGPIAADVPYEDQIMALRACCLGGGVTVAQPLLHYRRGGVSAAAGVADAAARRKRLQVKHTRQLAVYRQVEKDLLTAARPDLCGGRVRQKQAQSALALGLLEAGSWKERLALVQSARHAGPGWGWAQALTLPWPPASGAS
jgi:hypothetical protein